MDTWEIDKLTAAQHSSIVVAWGSSFLASFPSAFRLFFESSNETQVEATNVDGLVTFSDIRLRSSSDNCSVKLSSTSSYGTRTHALSDITVVAKVMPLFIMVKNTCTCTAVIMLQNSICVCGIVRD